MTGVQTCALPISTIASGFGTGAVITANSTAAFKVTCGSTSAATGTLTFPAAPNGWIVQGWDISNAAGVYIQQTASNATSATIAAFNMNSGNSTVFAASDVIILTATAY
mgnify:CR=1 FL=1